MTLPAHVGSRLNELASGHGLLLAAVSGGADSVALARLLQHAGLDFEIATVDHGIRRESSAADAAFVVELGKQLDVPVHAVRLDVPSVAAARGWNLEDAARRLRYSWLARTARETGATHVVTAHTRGDQAETVLLQLLRGAAWLTGMKPVHGRVLRPLLGTSGTALRQWLESLGQSWRDDATNFDMKLTRAWIRHEVLPGLMLRFPEADASLATLAELQADQAEFVREAARRHISDGRVDAGHLSRRHPALQREVIAELLRAAAAPLSFERVERVRRQLQRAGPWRESLSDGSVLRLAYGTLDVHSSRDRTAPAAVPVRQESDLPEGVAARALEYPELVIRTRRAKDVIRLQGGQRKLTDLLIDRKVPREDRDAIRVLASGSTVLWIEGLAVAADVALPGASPPDADRAHMRSAMLQAHAAAAAGELPVGAVVVKDGSVIAAAHNRTEEDGDATAHAEVLAIRMAAARLGDWRLEGCTLYVTLEPCPMCFGAIQQAHLAEVVYAAVNLREGALGGVAFLDGFEWKRRVTFRRGPMAEESAQLLRKFFELRRKRGVTVRWSGADP